MYKRTILILFFATTLSIKSEKVGLISIPKCGTHLAKKCIVLLTKKNSIFINSDNLFEHRVKNLKFQNHFFFTHAFYSKNRAEFLNKNNFKIIFIYRDPRDQIISNIFYLLMKPKKYPSLLSNSFNALISSFTNRIPEYYGHYIQWLKCPNVLPVKFENLIGKKGGGDEYAQKLEISKIMNFIGIRDKSKLDYCINNLFGDSPTFRKGQINTWNNYFTQAHKQQFKELTNNLLIDLEYEKDMNW